MKFRYSIALIIFFWAGLLHALDFRIRVFDPKTGKNLPDTQVIVVETKTRYFTDGKGEVLASVPKAGFYTLRAIAPDGQLVQPRFQILSPGQLITILTSQPEAQTSSPLASAPAAGPQIVGEGGIMVTGTKDKTRMSRYQVRIDEVKRIPGQFGEALRGMETLPGVLPTNFLSGEIIVRGANPNANTYLLDDLPMGFAFHIGGFNQVVHNDLIKAIDIYTGAYPALYGNATGGVVHIHTIDEVDRFGGVTNFSLWSTNTMFKGSLGEGNGYWYGAGRISYMHQVLKPYVPDGLRLPYYWDGQFKTQYRINPHHAIEFYAFGAKDTFGATISSKPSWDPTAEPDPILVGASVDLNRAFHTEAVKHRWTPGSRVTNELSLIYHDFITYVDGSIGIYEAVQSRHNGYAAVKDDFTWEVFKDTLTADAGFEVRNFLYRLNGRSIRVKKNAGRFPDPFDAEDPDYETVPVDDSENTYYNSGYGMLTFKKWGLEFKPGFRSEYFGVTKQQVVDPRATVSFTLPESWVKGTSFHAGGGRYHRVPDPWQYSRSSGNPDLRMEEARHYVIGFEQNYKSWTFKMEGFRFYFSDIAVSDAYLRVPYRLNDYKDLIKNPGDPGTLEERIQERIDEPIKWNDRAGWSNDGTGFSEGWELYLKRNLPEGKNGLYGWFTYTWSRSMRNNHQHIITDEEEDMILSADEKRLLHLYDNTKDGYASFDRTVVANIVLGWKLNREWQFGARWNYRTSPPYTEIVNDDGGTTFNSGRAVFYPEYSDVTLSKRMKPYHRLDIRIDRFINYEWGFGNIYLELLNVYLRENTESKGWSTGRPFSATNPEANRDFGSLQFEAGNGKYLKVPLFNIGLEMKF